MGNTRAERSKASVLAVTVLSCYKREDRAQFQPKLTVYKFDDS